MPARRRILVSLLIACASALPALAPAGAALLNWEGTLTLHWSDWPPAEIPGGGVASVNASGGVPAHLDSLVLEASRGRVGPASATFLVTDPEAAGGLVAAYRFEGVELGGGTFAPISGAAASSATLTQGILPIRGAVRYCFLSTSCAVQFAGLLSMPWTAGKLGVGSGGIIALGVDGTVRISIEGAPWTVHTVNLIDHVKTTGGGTTIITVTHAGFAHGPASGSTSTADVGGVVQLVTPMQVRSNIASSAQHSAALAAAMKLTIRFIPEPALLPLLGSGVLGLLVLGRKRWR